MKLRAALLATIALLSLTSCSRVPGVYVYESTSTSKTTAEFDPATYVDGIWASKIIPTVHDNAVDVATVAAALAADKEAAGKQYGKQAGTGSPYAFMVKGSGTVTKVDTDAPTGPVTVEVPAAAGGKPVTVTIATGPVIAGTALRDAIGLAFGDFTNQIAYADVANRINDRVKTDVTGKLDRASLVGKKISFSGAFSALSPGSIFLVPTELEVTP